MVPLEWKVHQNMYYFGEKKHRLLPFLEYCLVAFRQLFRGGFASFGEVPRSLWQAEKPAALLSGPAVEKPHCVALRTGACLTAWRCLACWSITGSSVSALWQLHLIKALKAFCLVMGPGEGGWPQLSFCQRYLGTGHWLERGGKMWQPRLTGLFQWIKVIHQKGFLYWFIFGY